MSSFTCIACRVAFADADLQRAHYRTDWHRYNLKRKVAELPPVTAETFQQKVLSQRPEAVNPTVGPRFCKACKKKFNSDKAYSEHLKSKKHRDNEARFEEKAEQSAEPGDDKAEIPTPATDDTVVAEDDTMEVVEGEEDEAIEPTDCLFCPHNSKNIEDNLRHMAKSHSFFIPDVEYLINPRGLLEYLGGKVGAGHLCIWCARPFACLEAVQQHMQDSGHTLLNYDDKTSEYIDFYDFRSSYPEGEAVKTRGEASSEGGDALSGGDDDDEIEQEYLDDTTGELVLPSGARAGHRSLQRYYRQSLRPERQGAAVVSAHSRKIDMLMRQYRAVGWTGSAAVVRAAQEKRRRDVDTQGRHYQRHQERLGWKANKLQNTYRRQVFLW